MLAGPPASYKSFLALDWALCMSSSRQWCDRETAACKVLYLLGEGKSNVLKRVQSWEIHNRVTVEQKRLIDDNFRISFEVPQMAIKPDVDKLLRDLQHADFEPNLVVIDTLARSFVGKNENDQLDSGLWIESADRLRQLGMAVVFLHHTAKNTEFGLRSRGSTVFAGAVDTAFMLQRDNEDKTVVKLTCTKQKDHDEGDPLYFQREVVQGSIVLNNIDKPQQARHTDESKQDEEARIDSLINDLLHAEYPSDRARARELATRTGKNEAWAQTRIRRAKGE
jgi:RecA-family ATPase